MEAAVYDYSRWLLPDLNENALDEAVGLNDARIAAFATTYWCTVTGTPPLGAQTEITTPGTANGRIDWNCNGIAEAAPVTVSVDLNDDGSRTTLRSYDDWAGLIYRGAGTIGGPGSDVTPLLQLLPPISTIQEEPLLIPADANES